MNSKEFDQVRPYSDEEMKKFFATNMYFNERLVATFRKKDNRAFDAEGKLAKALIKQEKTDILLAQAREEIRHLRRML